VGTLAPFRIHSWSCLMLYWMALGVSENIWNFKTLWHIFVFRK